MLDKDSNVLCDFCHKKIDYKTMPIVTTWVDSKIFHKECLDELRRQNAKDKINVLKALRDSMRVARQAIEARLGEYKKPI